MRTKVGNGSYGCVWFSGARVKSGPRSARWRRDVNHCALFRFNSIADLSKAEIVCATHALSWRRGCGPEFEPKHAESALRGGPKTTTTTNATLSPLSRKAKIRNNGTDPTLRGGV